MQKKSNSPRIARALAHPNIAFIKYWGNRDNSLRLPQTGSMSMCLADLQTETQVTLLEGSGADEFFLDGTLQAGPPRERVVHFLDIVRRKAGSRCNARVESLNNFPAGAGVASSASAFAALALAASRAYGMELSEAELSALARRGSGSASRSVPAGFVEWLPGSGDSDSYAVSIAPANHWDLVDVVTILDKKHKKTGSTEGHRLAQTSPLNEVRIRAVPERLERCRKAILGRDFESFAEVTEEDSDSMHAVMRTSTPALIYQTQLTLRILEKVKRWRKAGHAVCATVDAGPNVHVIALSAEKAWLEAELQGLQGVEKLLTCTPGGGAKLI